jgi:mono/diheme cytochrome c family protein
VSDHLVEREVTAATAASTRKWQDMLLTAVRACSLAAALLCSSHLAPACATEQGQMMFEAKCIACHENGQNVLQRGKTLFPSALEANGYATEDAIATLLVNGKGQM